MYMCIYILFIIFLSFVVSTWTLIFDVPFRDGVSQFLKGLVVIMQKAFFIFFIP